jgi:purine-binding chemotaxis protein CheW
MPGFAELLDDFFLRPDEAPLEGLDLPVEGEVPAAGEPQAPSEYLAFLLGDECYGVPIAEVREIVRVPPVTEVPRGGPDLLGVINLRGEVLPVYDLKLKLRLSASPARIAGPDADPGALPRGARILVIRGEDRGDLGLLVDGVVEVVRMGRDQVEPPPAGTSDRDYITGLGRRGRQLCILLDMGRALS